jgi:hypothetical protein
MRKILTMSKSPFLPEIENGLRNMPEGDVFAFMVRLVSAMIAGVALAGQGRHPSHPVHLCGKELVSLMQRLAESPTEYPTAALRQLAETVAARVWCLAYFQSDPDLIQKLESLVAPVFLPAPRLIGR